MKLNSLLIKSMAVLALSGLSLGTLSSTVNAGIWDDVKTIVGGHVDDAKGRLFGENTFIDGEVVFTGTFDEDAVGQDAAHWAKGTVSIETIDGKLYVQLGEDFNSGPLPDGHVYVSATKDINDEADFNNSVQIELGKLILSKGASYYEIPAGVTVNSVTVWCKQFGVYIGSADVM